MYKIIIQPDNIYKSIFHLEYALKYCQNLAIKHHLQLHNIALQCQLNNSIEDHNHYDVCHKSNLLD